MVKRYLTGALALVAVLSAVTFTGCKVGPKYERPAALRDSLFRFADGRDTNCMASLAWVTLFRDTVLQRLVTTGLKNNYDINIAYARIEQARANFKIERGKQWPTFGVSGTGGWMGMQPSSNNSSARSIEYSPVAATAGISWEIDIWGKMRRSKEAARAYLFAQEAYQQSVRIMLINEIVNNYFDLLELDNEMRITRENIVIREQSLQLVKDKMIAGTASGLVVAQAEAQLALAKAEVPGLEIQTGMKEDYLSTLLGEPPRIVRRGLGMLDQITPPSVSSPGLPSQLILRRPDIIMAEQQLVAANANIGVARAAMLPSLSISGSLGAAFIPTNLIYSAVANLVAPIFAGGQLRANVKKTQAQKTEMLLTYKKVIDNSLKEVSDALLQANKSKDLVAANMETNKAAQTAYELSDQLFNAGYASYLDVINAQSLLFQSQVMLSQAQKAQMASVVNLYTALGGGWK